MSLYLVRHGQPDYSFMNKTSHCSLSNLAPLTEKGREQALSLRNKMNSIKNSIVISSPYTRALQTAFLATGREDIIIDYDFHEWIPDKNFSINAKEFTEISWNFNSNLSSGVNYETSYELYERMQKALKKYEAENIVVFAHARLIACYLKGLGREEKYLKHCEVYEI